MSTKDLAFEIYKKHIALASIDGRKFRLTVCNEIAATAGCSIQSAAGYYNKAKLANPVPGLGRAPLSKNVRKPKNNEKVPIQHDNDCFSVIELIPNETVMVVGRCQSFLTQGDASEKFDEKIEAWPSSSWVMIQGLGPNSGDKYRLDAGEAEIKKYDAKVFNNT